MLTEYIQNLEVQVVTLRLQANELEKTVAGLRLEQQGGGRPVARPKGSKKKPDDASLLEAEARYLLRTQKKGKSLTLKNT